MGIDLSKIRKRSEKAWQARAPWDALYQEAYDFVLPMRRPGGAGKRKTAPDRLFDMTAPMSAMYFAGSLQRDLFPAGQPTFVLEAGPIAAQALSEEDRKKFDRELEKVATLIHPFFLSGDWDTAVHEMCIDLAMGTGAIIPLKGDPKTPVHFACVPFDQLAISVDAYGRVNHVSWKQMFEREQLIGAFPKGKWPNDYEKKAETHPTQEVELFQDFWADPQDRGWHYCSYVKESAEPIVQERTRAQPIAVPRYYRVPGEAYGRGVILTALPSIKTLNKAQELSLKSAAINLLGIWGYRSGGTFNPDTVRLGPGEFWAMQSTGGALGADVQRLDPASARFDVAKMLIGDLQQQIKQAMFDTRLPEYQGTPRSASEIAGRLRQKADVHIGAFGRLVNELMPVIVPRVAEILFEGGYLAAQPLDIDQLLVSIKVRSPMAAALNADRLASITNYLEMVASLAGPQSLRLYANMEKVMERIASGLQIDKDLIPTDEDRKRLQQEIAQAQEQQVALMAAQEGAKQAPGLLAKAVENEGAQ
jgi:dihydroneopterin aldolase